MGFQENYLTPTLSISLANLKFRHLHSPTSFFKNIRKHCSLCFEGAKNMFIATQIPEKYRQIKNGERFNKISSRS